jgi:hypothetical protein
MKEKRETQNWIAIKIIISEKINRKEKIRALGRQMRLI